MSTRTTRIAAATTRLTADHHQYNTHDGDDDDDDNNNKTNNRRQSPEGGVVSTSSSTSSTRSTERRELLFDLPPLNGRAGLDFDSHNRLVLPQLAQHEIRIVDPESGEILEQFPADSIAADDIVVGPDDTIYWTDIVGGTVYQRPPGGPTERLYPRLTYPFVDAITISDDGKHLYFAQCLHMTGKNGMYQRDLATGETVEIMGVGGGFLCASSGFTYHNGALYAAKIMDHRVFKIDLSTGTDSPVVTDLTKSVQWPTTVKFDSKGNLYTTDFFSSSVFQIHYDNDQDAKDNVELIATLPSFVDGLAFDKDDRLYVTSFFSGTVYEVLGETESRLVVD